MRLLVETLRDFAIIMLDPRGTVQSWSTGAEALHGYTAEEILGQASARFFPSEDAAAQRPARLLENAAREGRAEDEGWLLRKDGSRFWGNVTVSVIRGEAGAHLGFAQVTQDLTQRHLREEALRASEERFRLLVASVRDYAIFMLDPDGRVATWNLGAERTKGYLPQEIIGQHISRFYTPEDVVARRPWRLLKLAEEQGRIEDEGWRVRKDGTRFWADVVLTALRDAHGRLLGFAKVTRDLTEKRQAHEELRRSEERFRLLVSNVKDYAIFMIDPQGRVMTWNAGAERIKGYTAAEILGQHFSRFYTEEDLRSGKTELELEVAQRTGRFEDEGWRVRKDGTRFWASVILTAIRDESGTLLGYAKVTRDLTERRRSEEERLRLAQAQEAIRLRDEFLSIASHELRTPLTALQLQLQSLRERVESMDDKLAKRMDRATRSTERLSELVETLLDVARISTGRFSLKMQRFDLSLALPEMLERLAPAAAKAGCELSREISGPLMGTWDALRVEQILTNIVSNAIKYAAGTPIKVTLFREGDQAVLQVRDRGPGVPEQDLQRIFGRFERAASMRHYGGLGLGLYVSNQIVQAHGGSLDARNVPDGGVCFTVRLPLEPRVTQATPEPAAPEEVH